MFFLSQLLQACCSSLLFSTQLKSLESSPVALEVEKWNKAALMAAVLLSLKVDFFFSLLYFTPLFPLFLCQCCHYWLVLEGFAFIFPQYFLKTEYGLNFHEKSLLWFGPIFQEFQIHLRAVKRILPLPPSPRKDENKKKLFFSMISCQII